MLLQVLSCEPYEGVRARGFALSNSGICALRVSCDIHVKSHRKQNQVRVATESPYSAARDSTEGNEDMDLIAIQIGITAVLLIAHFFRLVWDRVFQSA